MPPTTHREIRAVARQTVDDLYKQLAELETTLIRARKVDRSRVLSLLRKASAAALEVRALLRVTEKDVENELPEIG
jgi:hypothetical protein